MKSIRFAMHFRHVLVELYFRLKDESAVNWTTLIKCKQFLFWCADVCLCQNLVYLPRNPFVKLFFERGMWCGMYLHETNVFCHMNIFGFDFFGIVKQVWRMSDHDHVEKGHELSLHFQQVLRHQNRSFSNEFLFSPNHKLLPNKSDCLPIPNRIRIIIIFIVGPPKCTKRNRKTIGSDGDWNNGNENKEDEEKTFSDAKFIF